MSTCPTCDRDFANINAMRGHHTKVHGEHLDNRTCKICGESFYDSKSQLKTCENCEVKGKNHPSYKSAKEETQCNICGKEFSYYPSSKKGMYCSQCVKEENWQETPKMIGSDNPRWKGGISKKTERRCSYCNEKIKLTRIRASKDNVFCNPQCCGKWKSENIFGEKHHHWKGGGNTEYGKGWTETKRKALERDFYTCQRCFESKDDKNYVVDVHHIKPVRTFDNPEDAHYLENVVTLCRPCHRRVEYNDDIPPRRSFFNY